MSRPRVIIADTDADYMVPLQMKFVKEFFDRIDLEIITERKYFDELFGKPQKAEILIISDNLYDPSLQRHNIANIFMMVEEYEEGADTDGFNLVRLFKYTIVKEIFSEIVGKSAGILDVGKEKRRGTQIILVTSACGGAGKTTLAMGISACLTRNYKRVLYIGAERLPSFPYMLDNQTCISVPEIYTRLACPDGNVYQDIRHVIRKEIFSYLPPFKAALMSVGLRYSVYEEIARSARESGEYDFIVLDAESTFDENKTALLDLADRVIVVTGQNVGAVCATNAFVSNVNGTDTDKYNFVCNNFDKDGNNALIQPDIVLKFAVNDYIESVPEYIRENVEALSKHEGIQKLSFSIM